MLAFADLAAALLAVRAHLRDDRGQAAVFLSLTIVLTILLVS